MMLCGVIELHARTHTTEYISIQNVSPKSKKCQSLLALVRRDKEKKKYTRRRQDGDGAMTNEDVARNREITRQENHRNLCQSQSYAVRTLSFSPLILPSNQNNAQELTLWRRAFTSLAGKKKLSDDWLCRTLTDNQVRHRACAPLDHDSNFFSRFKLPVGDVWSGLLLKPLG